MEQDLERIAAEKILAGLRSRRPADHPTKGVSLEEKVASITGVDFEADPKRGSGETESPVSEVGHSIADKTSEQILAGLRNKNDGLIRLHAAKNAGDYKDPKFVGDLINLLQDQDQNIRFWAARSLGLIKDPGSVEPLVDVLKNDADEAVRFRAAEALGEIKDPSAVSTLQEALKDKAEGVVQVAKWALQQIAEFEPKEEIDKKSESQDQEIVSLVADAFDKRAQEHLNTILETIEYYGKKGNVRDAISQKGLFEAEKSLYNMIGSVGKNLTVDYVKENLKSGTSGAERQREIENLVGILHAKLHTLRSVLVNSNCSHGRFGYTLQSKGIQQTEMNNCDLSDLYYHNVQDAAPNKAAMILGDILEHEPEKIQAYLRHSGQAEDFLKSEDYVALLELFNPQFTDFVFEEYKKLAVDTPERHKRRVAFEMRAYISGNGLLSLHSWSGERLNNLIDATQREKSIGEITSEERQRVVQRLRDLNIFSLDVANQIYDMYGDVFVEKRGVGANYIIAADKQQNLEELVSEYAKNEVEKIVKEVIAERKPETAFVLEQNQQEIVEKVAGNLKREYQNLIKEYDGFKQFTNDEKIQLVNINTMGAIRTIGNEIVEMLQLPENLQKLASDEIYGKIRKIVFEE